MLNDFIGGETWHYWGESWHFRKLLKLNNIKLGKSKKDLRFNQNQIEFRIQLN